MVQYYRYWVCETAPNGSNAIDIYLHFNCLYKNEDWQNFGKMAALILAILIGTTAVSAAVGIFSATVFDLDATQILQGDAETARGQYLEEKLRA